MFNRSKKAENLRVIFNMEISRRDVCSEVTLFPFFFEKTYSNVN